MDEFDLDSYARAQALADRVFNYATSIHDVFDDIDGLMNMLHGQHWGSTGSEDVNAQYLGQIKTQFEPFYQDVVAMNKHVYAVTSADVATDRQAEATIDS